MNFSAEEIALNTGGLLVNNSDRKGRIVTDTRILQPGDWYLALQGENFDGHEFLEKAKAAGCIGAITSGIPENWDADLVVVSDTLKALQDLARFSRSTFEGTVVGLTGSAGKTTTRSIISLALSPGEIVHETSGNYNNHIGLPITLLNRPDNSTILVLEMGMSGLGEIHLLQDISRPHIRLITNIGAAHTQGVGGIDGVVKAKGELFAGALPDDILCLNIDDSRIKEIPISKDIKVITYGQNIRADVRLLESSTDPDTLRTSFLIEYCQNKYEGWINSPGKHMAINVCAAFAVVAAMEKSFEPAIDAIKLYQPVGFRQKIVKGPNDSKIILDCYNANPSSMEAALEMMATLPGRKIALLGDMLELDDNSAEQHSLILKKAKALGMIVAACGEQMSATGIADISARDVESLAPRALELIEGSNDIILIKGSRSMRMEQILTFWE